MDPHMSFQTSLSGESFATNSTAKWFLSGVDARVPLEMHCDETFYCSRYSQMVSLLCEL